MNSGRIGLASASVALFCEFALFWWGINLHIRGGNFTVSGGVFGSFSGKTMKFVGSGIDF
jgi:hypothetical protein